MYILKHIHIRMEKVDIDTKTLNRFRKIVESSQTNEISGSVIIEDFAVTNISISNKGDNSEVRLPKDCVECFHTHPPPPMEGLISVPSGTDLLVAYSAKPGTRQWLATTDGLWIYWRNQKKKSNILDFFASFKEPHPVTLNRMIVDWCLSGSITYPEFMNYVEQQLALDILFYKF